MASTVFLIGLLSVHVVVEDVICPVAAVVAAVAAVAAIAALALVVVHPVQLMVEYN